MREYADVGAGVSRSQSLVLFVVDELASEWHEIEPPFTNELSRNWHVASCQVLRTSALLRHV
jgi:hypothetical protein